MATKNERVSYIAARMKALGAPSETAIAICCNIRAESGANFNPQAIENGSGAPPFVRNGQGYGLFQFSNYPTNHNIYTACKGKGDKAAIEYQINQVNAQCQPGKGIWLTSRVYPKYNLSWKEFLTNKHNWSPRELTKCFMCQYERPADQSQDRYAMFSKEVADAYDWSKYDANGGENAGNGDHETYNFDCGGAKIVLPKDPDPPVDPGGGGGSFKPTSKVQSALKKIEARQKTGVGWTNSGGYQCVALFQYGLFQTADSAYKDGQVSPRGTAIDYGRFFDSKLNSGKKAANLSPKKWTYIKNPKKFYRGDAIFYTTASAKNGRPGHVSIARNTTQCWNQNVSGRLDGSNPRIESRAIKFGAGLPIHGVLRKTKD